MFALCLAGPAGVHRLKWSGWKAYHVHSLPTQTHLHDAQFKMTDMRLYDEDNERQESDYDVERNMA